MTYEEFTKGVWDAVKECPKSWRKGQAVFNVVENLYGAVAREVQMFDGVDCFYDDYLINNFLWAVWQRIKPEE